jgi:hypothetical protein
MQSEPRQVCFVFIQFILSWFGGIFHWEMIMDAVVKYWIRFLKVSHQHPCSTNVLKAMRKCSAGDIKWQQTGKVSIWIILSHFILPGCNMQINKVRRVRSMLSLFVLVFFVVQCLYNPVKVLSCISQQCADNQKLAQCLYSPLDGIVGILYPEPCKYIDFIHKCRSWFCFYQIPNTTHFIISLLSSQFLQYSTKDQWK